MKVSYVGNDIILDDVKCLDLDLTLDCGQAFRWEKQADSSWSGVVKGVFLNISKMGDTIILKNTSKDDFENIWIDYFDFNNDYVCSFVISQQNNIIRIKGIISRLCRIYGEEVRSGFYSFPSAERLSNLTVEDFENLGTGYRAKYLERLAKDVASGAIDLEKIKTLSLDDARKELLNIYGVGIKVANCALLFGFGFYDAFPVDVWMKRVMEYYPDGLPQCFDGIGGIAQQYLFHWARNHL